MAAECYQTDVVSIVNDDADPRATLGYDVRGVADEAAAALLLLATLPANFLGLAYKSHRLELESTNPDDTDNFTAEVEYARRDSKPVEIGDWVFNFDTGGGTAKRTQNIETIEIQAVSGESEPDDTGAIGVTDNGVEGTDVVIPALKFSIEYQHHPSAATTAHAAALADLSGHTNASTFLGFAPGTVLFLNATGKFSGSTSYDPSDTDVKPVPITYNFMASPDGYVTGAGLNVWKPGWAYAEWRYRETKSSDGKTTKKIPVALIIHKVYDSTSFSLIPVS